MFSFKNHKISLAIGTSLIVFTIFFSSSYSEDNKEIVDESEKIMKLQKEWSAKSVAGDLDWIINLHTDDAIQLPPGGDIIQGKDGLKVAWDGMVNTEGLEVSWEPTKAFVSKSGDMAYDYGTAKIKNPDGSIVNAKYLVVWKKVDDEWKVVADIFNMNGAGLK